MRNSVKKLFGPKIKKVSVKLISKPKTFIIVIQTFTPDSQFQERTALIQTAAWTGEVTWPDRTAARTVTESEARGGRERRRGRGRCWTRSSWRCCTLSTTTTADRTPSWRSSWPRWPGCHSGSSGCGSRTSGARTRRDPSRSSSSRSSIRRWSRWGMIVEVKRTGSRIPVSKSNRFVLVLLQIIRIILPNWHGTV